MKNSIKSFLIILFALPLFVNAQLSGTYSLGGSGIKNFSTWQELADSISLKGVSGKVTILVKSNLSISNTLTLKQPKSNTISSTNTLTIDGNGFSILGNLKRELVLLDGIDYVNFKHLNFQNTSTNGNSIGLRFTNQADYNTIDSCSILLGKITHDATDTGAYIAFSKNDSLVMANSSTNNGIGNIISYCTMKTSGGAGPRYAVINQQSSKTYLNTETQNQFIHNKIQNFYNGVFYMRYVRGEIVSGNSIDRSDASSNDNPDSTLVIFHLQDMKSAGVHNEISNNTISNLPYYSTSLSTANTSAYNFIGFKLDNAGGNDTTFLKINNNHFNNIYLANSFTGIISDGDSCLQFDENTFNRVFTEAGNSFGVSFTKNHNFQLKKNQFRNSEFSISGKGYTQIFYLYSNSNSSNFANTLDFNIVDSVSAYYLDAFYIYGTSDYNLTGNTITNNLINSSDWTSFKAIYCLQTGQTNVVSNLIANNNNKGQSLLVYSENYSALNEYNFYYNTVVHNDSFSSWTGENYISFFYNYGDVNYVGNIVEAKGKAGVYMNFINNTGLIADNNIYSGGKFSSEYWHADGNDYYNFNDWVADAKVGPSNYKVSPKFINPGKSDFRSGASKNQNSTKETSLSSLDLYGNKRQDNYHDIGAIESVFDLGLNVQKINKYDTLCSGTIVNPTIWLKNNFIDTITEVRLGYKVNGISHEENFKLVLKPKDSIDLNFVKKIRVDNTGLQNCSIYIATVDDTQEKDTFHFNIYIKPAPGGSQLNAVIPNTGNSPIFSTSSNKDICIRNLLLQYEVSKPRGFSNSDYGKTWTADAMATTAGGRTVSGASVTAPGTSKDLLWNFNSNDTAIDDSTLIWKLKITDLQNGCDTIIERLIYISPSPELAFTLNQTICSKDSLKFINKSEVKSTNVFLEYKWDFGTGNPSDTSILNEPIFIYDTDGTYKVTLNVNSLPHGFKFETSKSISVIATPTVDFKRTNACDGIPVQFENLSSPKTSKMTWNFGSGDTVISKLIFTNKFTNYGTYNVSLSAENNGCSVTKTSKITVYEQPKAQFELTSGTCQFQPFSFTNQTSMKTSLFGNVWDFDETDGKSTNRSPKYNFQTYGNKKVKLIVNSEFGCSDSITKTISVQESPKIEIAILDTCSLREGKVIDLTTSSNNFSTTRSWKIDGQNSGTKDTLKINWKNAGTYAISLSVLFDNGCNSTLDRTIKVLREIKPEFTVKNACSGDSIEFKNNTTFLAGDSIRFFWDYGDGNTYDGFQKNRIYNVSQTTVYNVLLRSIIPGGCESDVVEKVDIWENPKTCEFVSTPAYEKGYYGITFEPASSQSSPGGQSGVSYNWNLDGIGNQASSGANAAVFYDLPSDGDYNMTMIATTDAHGCVCSSTQSFKMDRLSTELNVNADIKIYPNPTIKGSEIRVESNQTFLGYKWYNYNGQLLTEGNCHFSNNFNIRLPENGQGLLRLVLINEKGSSAFSVMSLD